MPKGKWGVPTLTPDASREPGPAAIFLPFHFSLGSTQQVASALRGTIPAAPTIAAAEAGVAQLGTACARRTPRRRHATHLTSASERRMMCANIAKAMTTIAKENAPPIDLRDPRHNRPPCARQTRDALTYRLPDSMLDAWGAAAPADDFRRVQTARARELNQFPAPRLLETACGSETSAINAPQVAYAQGHPRPRLLLPSPRRAAAASARSPARRPPGAGLSLRGRWRARKGLCRGR